MKYYNVISLMPKTSYDADAQAFFNAQATAGVTLTTTQKNAVNQWVIDSKAIGVWTKMKAIYPIVGGTATSHKFNLKNPLDTDASFRLSFIGGWTHSATGMLPNGTNAYANTFCTTANMALNSVHHSFYSRTDQVATNAYELGIYQTTPNSNTALLLKGQTGSALIGKINNSGTSTTSTTNSDSTGYYITSRTASNLTKTFKNSSIFQTSTVLSGAVSTNPYFISALNNLGSPSFYSLKESAFVTIGDGLTDLELQLLYQITEKYQVALSRNINAIQSFYYNIAYNNETNAFLFSTQITDATIQTSINTLVNSLKTAGVWTKMKAIYPIVGGTSTTHKYNLVNPQDADSAFRLVFAGGVTHSSSGVLFNGTNGWADSFMNMASTFTAYDIHLSANINSDFVGTLAQGHIGSNASATSCNRLGASGSTSESSLLGGTSGFYTVTKTVTSTTHKGFWCGSRTANNVHNFIDPNGTITSNTTTTTSTQPSLTLGLGCRRGTTNDFYSGFGYSFFSAGTGLTTTEMTDLKTAVNTFQTNLGRI